MENQLEDVRFHDDMNCAHFAWAQFLKLQPLLAKQTKSYVYTHICYLHAVQYSKVSRLNVIQNDKFKNSFPCTIITFLVLCIEA